MPKKKRHMPGKIPTGRERLSKPQGRPPKLNDETHEIIIMALRAGNYLEVAAAHAGVHRETVFAWLRKGKEQSSGIYHNFHHAVTRARAAAEIRDVANLAKAGSEDWRASAWRLERKHPDRWGKQDKLELSGPDGEPITTQARIDPRSLSDEQLSQLRRMLKPKAIKMLAETASEPAKE